MGEILWYVGVGIFTAGASWGGAKVALNGTRQRVVDLSTTFAQHVADDKAAQLESTDRLARIETKIDVLMEKN